MMRLHEFFLVEYKTEITQQKYGEVLRQISDDPNILQKIEGADPTKNKQYVLWIIKQLQSNLIRDEDLNRVKGALTNYHQLKHKLPVEQRDINSLTIHELEAIVDGIMDVDLDSEHEDLNINLPKGSYDLLYNGPLGTLVVPKTEEAACELGRGTKWCTSADKKNQFNHYNKKGPLYIWKDKTGKYQFQFETTQFVDSRDRLIPYGQLMGWRKHPVISKLFKRHESKLINDGDVEQLYGYSQNVIQGRWPEAEPVIMQDPNLAYEYARDIIKGRWPEAEPFIMKHRTDWADYKSTFRIKD